MSTTFYLNKEPIGIRTFEQKQRVFRWIMHPITFIRRVMDMSQPCEIKDEYGNTMYTMTWIMMMQEIDVSIYNRDDAQSLE